MKKILNKVERWKFDKKMRSLISGAIIATVLLALAVSTISSVSGMTNQSKVMLKEQVDSVADNFESSLENYKSIAIALTIDSSIQKYLKYNDVIDARYYTLTNIARDSLTNCINMWKEMNFVSIVSEKNNTYLYKGNSALANTQFGEVYRSDYEDCKYVQNSPMKIGFNNAYFKGNNYTLNIYYPLYDVDMLSKELGFLCMNFNDTSLDRILLHGKSSINSSISVIDIDGMNVSNPNRKLVGTKVDYLDHITKNQGSFKLDGKVYIYQKLVNWNLYVVSSIMVIELYKPSIQVIVLMTILMALLVSISLIIVQKVIKKAYRPLGKVVEKMDNVASGSLEARMSEKYMGEDFIKLAIGFNIMMDKIQVLMETVKSEQEQMEHIRFNALQSQIQPHFLYNTLECIHWQAIADGNKEVSTLVKALAKYYRVCLSKGKDVISLEQEVEHMENYLIIQNIRYDNIIEVEVLWDDELREEQIPKLTLQPLVENSIYHGMRVKEGKKGKVTLRMTRKGQDVLLTLSDSGNGMRQEDIDEMNRSISEYDESFGYGVRNVNKRIELLYGNEYGLEYKKNEYGGVTVEIHIPYKQKCEGWEDKNV